MRRERAFPGAMTTRHPPFGDRPFSVAEGIAAGVGRGALAGPRFAAPFHGVREWREVAPAAPGREAVLRSCLQYRQRMGVGQFYSHDTALCLHGAPLPGGWRPEVLHVSVHRPQQAPRTRGVRGHRLQERPSAVVEVEGLPVESPVRAWVQMAHSWSFTALVAAGDFLVARGRPLATLDELREEAAWARRSRVLAPALAAIRVGSESPGETRLRLLLSRGGLPEPELNTDIYDDGGTFLGRGDIVFRRWRVLVEYDGRQHAEDVHQFARDADRWHALDAAGWRLVRVLHHHMSDGGATALRRVEAALSRAGWRR